MSGEDEVEKLETEHKILEQELGKLDDLADQLEDFEQKSNTLGFN